MEFKLNKLTLVLLSAPLIANAGISHNGSEHNLLPSNLVTNITLVAAAKKQMLMY